MSKPMEGGLLQGEGGMRGRRRDVRFVRFSCVVCGCALWPSASAAGCGLCRIRDGDGTGIGVETKRGQQREAHFGLQPKPPNKPPVFVL